MNKPLKVAITGNIAAGKTQVETYLKSIGYNVLDTDIVAHELLFDPDVKQKIINAFADFDILENDEISRNKLASIVFTKAEYKKSLENILHPIIEEEIHKFFKKYEQDAILFVSIPQLFEAKMEYIFDKIILVYADDKIRLKRLMQRNNMDIQTAQRRLSSQISQRAKQSLSDFVIHNNDTIERLNEQINAIITNL